jgi:hypothetical protein
MSAKPEIAQTGEDQPAQQPQTSPPDDVQEAARVAALLRDRFGTEH